MRRDVVLEFDIRFGSLSHPVRVPESRRGVDRSTYGCLANSYIRLCRCK